MVSVPLTSSSHCRFLTKNECAGYAIGLFPTNHCLSLGHHDDTHTTHKPHNMHTTRTARKNKEHHTTACNCNMSHLRPSFCSLMCGSQLPEIRWVCLASTTTLHKPSKNKTNDHNTLSNQKNHPTWSPIINNDNILKCTLVHPNSQEVQRLDTSALKLIEWESSHSCFVMSSLILIQKPAAGPGSNKEWRGQWQRMKKYGSRSIQYHHHHQQPKNLKNNCTRSKLKLHLHNKEAI